MFHGYNGDGTLGTDYSNASIGKLALWTGAIPTDLQMKRLTDPNYACSADPREFAPEGLQNLWNMRGQSPETDGSGNSNTGVLTNTPALVAGPCAAQGKPLGTKQAGLLTASSNGRYFQANGQTIVLTGGAHLVQRAG